MDGSAWGVVFLLQDWTSSDLGCNPSRVRQIWPPGLKGGEWHDGHFYLCSQSALQLSLHICVHHQRHDSTLFCLGQLAFPRTVTSYPSSSGQFLWKWKKSADVSCAATTCNTLAAPLFPPQSQFFFYIDEGICYKLLLLQWKTAYIGSGHTAKRQLWINQVSGVTASVVDALLQRYVVTEDIKITFCWDELVAQNWTNGSIKPQPCLHQIGIFWFRTYHVCDPTRWILCLQLVLNLW